METEKIMTAHEASAPLKRQKNGGRLIIRSVQTDDETFLKLMHKTNAIFPSCFPQGFPLFGLTCALLIMSFVL